MITFEVKRNGRLVLGGIQRLAAAKYTARHEGGDVMALDDRTGVTWKVGSWEMIGGVAKWIQVGPKS